MEAMERPSNGRIWGGTAKNRKTNTGAAIRHERLQWVRDRELSELVGENWGQTKIRLPSMLS